MSQPRSLIASLILSLICVVAFFVVTSSPNAKELAVATEKEADKPAKSEPNATAKTEIKRIEVPLNGHVFSLPEGFTIELVAGLPLVDRPITASFDEEGRLYVSDSSGTNDPSAKQLIDKPHRVVRLEDTDGDGKFDKSTVFADKLMFPEGTLWHDASLYVAAPPSIWKLTDTDGDGVADKREEWFKGNTLTGCANDLHGPYLGPDGFLYWCKGAFAEQTYERPVRPVGWDSVPTRSTNENAETKTKPVGTESQPTKPWTTKASHIFRARPDAPRDPATGSIKTSAIECVMTGGMDNPVDVVFTPTGERIFTTTFLVHPGGGNRDGLLHAVYGGVYGKDWNVIDSPSHPRTGDVMPVLCHLGAAAPCGLERLQSSTWGREYQDNLFACCFNMRKVTRHVLQPHGATFKTEAEDFVVSNNLDFHPTDVLEDADGSLLIVDTGGWYKLCCPTSQLAKPDVLGAIYRVRKLDVSRNTDPFGRKIDWKNLSADNLVRLLDDARTHVRLHAANVLEQRGADAVPALAKAARWNHLGGDREVERVTRVLWSLARVDHPDARQVAINVLKNADRRLQQVAAHSVSLWRDRNALPELTLLGNGGRSVDRVKAEALGRIGDKSAVHSLLWSATVPDLDRFVKHSIIYALIEIGDAEQVRQFIAPNSFGKAQEVFAHPLALIALDQMPNGGLKPEELAIWLTSSDPMFSETAAWIISRHADWGEALAGYLRDRLDSGKLTDAEQKTLGQQLAQFAKASSVQELLAATVRGGGVSPPSPTSPKPTRDASATARLTALRAMQDSKLKELPRSWSAALLSVLAEDREFELINLAVKTVRAIPPHKEDAAAWQKPLLLVATFLPDADAEPDGIERHLMRLNALAALPGGLPVLPEFGDKFFNYLLTQLAPERPVALRSTAAEILSKAKLPKEQLTKLTEQFATAGPLEVDRLLSAFEQTTDEQVGQKLIAALKTAPALTALRADAIKTRLAKYSPAIQDSAHPLYAALNVDLAGQKQRLEEMLASLPAGDIRRGQAVFNNEKAACKACHAMGYLGGKTGPDLTRIGGIRNERDLLESILFPSASLVRSFEPMLIVTQDGKTVNGLIRSETSDELVIATGPNQEVRVARSNIEEIRPSSVSIMPAGLEKQLTLEQLADLIAFLKASK